ncbi:hypothetical protein F5Y14DRAFT_457027 [Nemania sp. NC0429]|nr:hypothetical protein F5Y14DRAFT_457027 [Nemania sp. NC0429]
MFFARLILVVCVLFGGVTDARYLVQRDLATDHLPGVYTNLQPRDSGNDGRPSCRRICGSCGSSCSSTTASKRSLLELVTFNNTAEDELGAEYDDTGRLLKRTLRNVRQTNIGGYLQGKIQALVSTRENLDTNLINLAYSTDQNDFTFAALRDFSKFGANVLNIGIQGLEGCTVLTIVSRKAVYMAHFFENLAFAPDDKKDPNEAFQENCLNLITGQDPTWRKRGDSLDPSLFTGDNGPARAYIMTPRPDQDSPTAQNPNPPVPGPGEQLYAGRITQLSQTLTGLIPGLEVVYYNYIAVNVEKQQQAYQGKALFEFDPNADGSSNPNFRLWYEQTMNDGRAMGLIT